MSLISMLCPRCLGDSFERDHAYKCRPPELDMTPTVPPSPAQGETAGVSEAPNYYMRDISGYPHKVVFLSDHQAVIAALRQQLADSAHEVERLNAANAAMRVKLADIARIAAAHGNTDAERQGLEQIFDIAAPTSHDPVRSAGETSPVPSRGKCELPTSHEIGVAARAGSDAESDPYSYRIGFRAGANWLYDRVSPDCAQGGSPADPERQVPDILNELIGDGKYRYNLNDDQINALRELIKPSPPIGRGA